MKSRENQVFGLEMTAAKHLLSQWTFSPSVKTRLANLSTAFLPLGSNSRQMVGTRSLFSAYIRLGFTVIVNFNI